MRYTLNTLNPCFEGNQNARPNRPDDQHRRLPHAEGLGTRQWHGISHNYRTTRAVPEVRIVKLDASSTANMTAPII
jgi:hypothetical protein